LISYLIPAKKEKESKEFRNKLAKFVLIMVPGADEAAEFFASEVHGQRGMDSNKIKKFLETLQLILTKTI
jgi:hypothetical protein